MPSPLTCPEPLRVNPRSICIPSVCTTPQHSTGLQLGTCYLRERLQKLAMQTRLGRKQSLVQACPGSATCRSVTTKLLCAPCTQMRYSNISWLGISKHTCTHAFATPLHDHLPSHSSQIKPSPKCGDCSYGAKQNSSPHLFHWPMP